MAARPIASAAPYCSAPEKANGTDARCPSIMIGQRRATRPSRISRALVRSRPAASLYAKHIMKPDSMMNSPVTADPLARASRTAVGSGTGSSSCLSATWYPTSQIAAATRSADIATRRRRGGRTGRESVGVAARTRRCSCIGWACAGGPAKAGSCIGRPTHGSISRRSLNADGRLHAEAPVRWRVRPCPPRSISRRRPCAGPPAPCEAGSRCPWPAPNRGYRPSRGARLPRNP